MRSFIIFVLFALALAHPPRLVEVAKAVNARKTTWIANEAIPTRDYSQYLGIIKTGVKAPVKNIEVRNDLPKEFDAAEEWPECPSLKEIRDQSTCGSCWAFGAAEAATDRLCIASEGKIQARLSDEDLLTCCSNCGLGCNGGDPEAAWYFMVRYGISTGGENGSTEWCKAYSFPKCEHHGCTGPYPECGATQPTPECIKKCQEGYPIPYEQDKHFFKSVYSIPKSVREIKTELMNFGPIEVGFTVYEDFLTYKSGIYQHVEGKPLGGHAVKLVGWGVEDGIEYWKVANSWNETWGEDGFFRIILGKNECEIEEHGVTAMPDLE